MIAISAEKAFRTGQISALTAGRGWWTRMSDLISRQAAIDIVKKYSNICIDELRRIPPKSPHPQTGAWNKENRGGVEYTAVCTTCGFTTFWSDTEYFNYCPNCGAKQTRYEHSNFCVACGEEIPEGDMICPICKSKILKENII